MEDVSFPIKHLKEKVCSEGVHTLLFAFYEMVGVSPVTVFYIKCGRDAPITGRKNARRFVTKKKEIK